MRSPSVPDIRLLAIDLDGTLLNDAKRIDPLFWPLLAELERRGIVVCPASGRQHESIRRLFAPHHTAIVAENGAYATHGGQSFFDAVTPEAVASTLRAARRHLATGADAGVVLCGSRSAYVERADASFLDQVAPYYPLLTHVEDLEAVTGDEFLKVALFDAVSAQDGIAAALPRIPGTRAVLSGQHWVDVMSPTADKGAALRALQSASDVGPEHTMAFGDFHNDLGMLAAAEWSYAMAGAHPDVVAHARHRAPSNNDNGVVRTVAEVLEIDVGIGAHARS